MEAVREDVHAISWSKLYGHPGISMSQVGLCQHYPVSVDNEVFHLMFFKNSI